MLDKVFVGPRVSNLDTGTPTERISRVTLVVDGTSAYTAGDDTGRTVEKSLPWATQAMAESVLRSLQSVTYLPFSGEDALLDPAAEIGDGVTAGGVYSVLAKADMTFDGLYTADIAAPGGDEVEDEYPYKSRAQRQAARELAKIRSSIIKTAEAITLRVENEIESLSGQLQLTESSLTAEIANTAAELRGELELTASNFQVQISGLDNAYSAIRSTVDSIGFGVYNGTESSTITMYKDGIAVSSQEIKFTGIVTFSDLEGNAGTVIDGAAIKANTLKLDSLHGNNVYLYDLIGNVGAEFRIGAASSAKDRCELWANAIMMGTYGGHIYLNSGTSTVEIGNYNMQVDVNVIPNRANMFSCGSYGFPWVDVYSQDGTISKSDRAGKTAIDYNMSRYSGLFDRLRPCSFLRKNGTSGRRHHGFIAQEVKAALAAEGLTDMDFAGYVEWDGGCGLRYEEILAMVVYELQKLKKQAEGRFAQ